jgi:hypothetical protein
LVSKILQIWRRPSLEADCQSGFHGRALQPALDDGQQALARQLVHEPADGISASDQSHSMQPADCASVLLL